MPLMRLTISVAPVRSAPVLPGGDDRVALAVTQEIQRNGHGRILLAAGGGAGVVLHGDDLACVDYLKLALCAALFFKAGFHILDTADKADFHAELALCAHRALYDLLRGIVAAHCVNDYLHSEKPP